MDFEHHYKRVATYLLHVCLSNSSSHNDAAILGLNSRERACDLGMGNMERLVVQGLGLGQGLGQSLGLGRGLHDQDLFD